MRFVRAILEKTDKEHKKGPKRAFGGVCVCMPQELTIPEKVGHVWIYEGMA